MAERGGARWGHSIDLVSGLRSGLDGRAEVPPGISVAWGSIPTTGAGLSAHGCAQEGKESVDFWNIPLTSLEGQPHKQDL